MEGSIRTSGGLRATSSSESSRFPLGAAHRPVGFRLERWLLLWRGPMVSPCLVTLKVSDPPGRTAVSGVARPALPLRLPGHGRPRPPSLVTLGAGAPEVKESRVSPTPCRHAPRRGRCWRSSSLKLPNRRWAGLGARPWEPGLNWRRRGKQVKREGRGEVTAHKSPSPTLGPHRSGAPAPRGMEGHSATPGRPLSSPGASAPPWAQAALRTCTRSGS